MRDALPAAAFPAVAVPATTESRVPARLTRLLWCSALAVTVVGLAAMAWLAPRVLYADPWRFTQSLLELPWPRNVLASDNGHREILPNLVRYAELVWLQGNQWLQIITGMLLAVLSLAGMACILRRDAAAPVVRAAGVLTAALSLFWVGSQRVLTHANETVHAYLITALLVAGVAALLRGGGRGVAMAALCGIAATFSFGSGVAVFVGFAAVLVVRRAPWQHWLVLAAGAALAVGVHLGMGNTGMRSDIVLAPLRQLDLLLRWLASPFIYAAWPLLDPAIAQQLPVAPLRATAMGVASGYQSVFGPVMGARWPHLLLGLAGVSTLLAMSWQSWRRGRTASAGEVVALALAWFGLAVGGLIALGRMGYFFEYPDQLSAPRYVLWSWLFWCGLVLWAVVRIGPRRPRRTAGLVLLMTLALLPSTVWMGMLGLGMQRVASATATAVAAGVVDPAQLHGETVLSELRSALPVVRAQRISMFAWPETRYLQGERAGLAGTGVAIGGAALVPVENALGGPAWRIDFDADSSAKRLVLQCGERPVGLALRAGGRWMGWATGPLETDCLGALQLR